MNGWRQTTHLNARERLDVLQLLNEIEGQLQRAPIDEVARRMVLHNRQAGFWLKEDNARIVGFALVSGEDPAVGEMAGGSFDYDLINSVTAQHPHLHWWVRDEQQGLPGIPIRTLLMMSAELNTEFVDKSSGLIIRPFDIETDLEAWIATNNAAFATHPEQGTWNKQDLIERLGEPWFDPSGFLVVHDGDDIVASVWTKTHELHPLREGEIYVLWVSPKHQGRGLGAVALTAGLRNLQLKGTSRVMLFVEESNKSAKTLYESFGFTVQRRDQMVLFEK